MVAEKTTYKWELRKGSRKEICPNCGYKRFVPYVSSKDGVTLAGDKFGRCDREQNCGYLCYPSDVSDATVVAVERPQLRPLTFRSDCVQVDPSTNLFVFVSRLLSTSAALRIWNKYRIGNDNGRTLFWQIDCNGVVRGGKSIPYKTDGHRDKSDRLPACWLHKSSRWKQFCDGDELKQCLYGEHLLKGNDMPVVVVESEKTASVMSELAKNHIWLATGGSQGIKSAERLHTLQGRKVLLMPDNGQYWSWKAVADAYGWETDDLCETFPVFEGCDILDYVECGKFDKYIRKLNNYEDI